MQAPLEIALLRSFVAVARLGSISAAAIQIGRTQSAVSMQMRRLEANIGAPILHRSGSGVSTTRAGDRLLAHAHAILNLHDQALSDLAGPGLRGSICVGCPEDYLNAFLPGVLMRFAADHPAVEVEILCAPTVDLKPMLHRREVDLAIVSEPLSSGPLSSGPLSSGPGGVLRHTRFVWVANDPAPSCLHAEIVPLALSASNTLDHQAACDALHSLGRAYRVAFASNSLAGLLAIARSGHAISVVTELAVPGDLFVIEDDLPPLPEIGIRIAGSAGPGTEAIAEFRRIASAMIGADRSAPAGPFHRQGPSQPLGPDHE